MVFAQEGFNVIATANTRDRGVNEMSAALKRRFNFETVFPIGDFDTELALVAARGGRRCCSAPACRRAARTGRARGAGHDVPRAARRGDRATATRWSGCPPCMSTAEAVSRRARGRACAATSCAARPARPTICVECLAGTAAKDNAEDLAQLRRYLEQQVSRRTGAALAGPLRGSALLTHNARHPLPDCERLAVLGVRHHSPACARLVRETIDRLRPAYVLIEGPADMNPHLDELAAARAARRHLQFHATATSGAGLVDAVLRLLAGVGGAAIGRADRRGASVHRPAGLASGFRRPGEPLRRRRTRSARPLRNRRSARPWARTAATPSGTRWPSRPRRISSRRCSTAISICCGRKAPRT